MKQWTKLGIVFAGVICLPVAWTVLRVGVAIADTPGKVDELRISMTNSFAVLGIQLTDVDASSKERDSNIVVQLHGEISQNRLNTYTNFQKLLQRLDGKDGIRIDP